MHCPLNLHVVAHVGQVAAGQKHIRPFPQAHELDRVRFGLSQAGDCRRRTRQSAHGPLPALLLEALQDARPRCIGAFDTGCHAALSALRAGGCCDSPR